jgi:Leucine-rich repeat (LRR) protein
MKRLHFLSFVLLSYGTFATYPIVAMEENAQTCDTSCSSSSQTNKSNFAPSHQGLGSNSPLNLDTIPPVATPQTFNTIKCTQLEFRNKKKSPLLAKFPSEIIRLIATYLPKKFACAVINVFPITITTPWQFCQCKELSSMARASRGLKNALYGTSTDDTNLLDIKSRFFAVAKKLNKNPEQFWNDWIQYKKINFSNYKFKNRAELEQALLTFVSVWHEIKELDFSSCNITQLPDTFETLLQLDPQKYPNLRNLKLHLPKLTKLNLSFNRLDYIPFVRLFTMLKNQPSFEAVDLTESTLVVPDSVDTNSPDYLEKIQTLQNF